MQIPPEIIIKGFKTTPFEDKIIRRGIAGLEQVCNYIISTRVIIEQAQKSHQTGNPYRISITVNIPDRSEIIVKRWSKGVKKIPGEKADLPDETRISAKGKHLPVRRGVLPKRGLREEPLAALVGRAFDSARRELERAVEKQRGDVKTPAYQPSLAIVEKIFRDDGYGFIRTIDGQQVYFHKNSMLHNHWNSLTVGTSVRYTPELGEKGLQASTVEPVEKRGVAESHDVLHELPALAEPRSHKKQASHSLVIKD